MKDSMEFLLSYWSQITVLLGVLGYTLKIIFENRFKNKELRFKNFYELRSTKITDLHTKIVEIQIILDRKKGSEELCLESNILQKRIGLDKFYWESQLYFSTKTQKVFYQYLEWLKYFENKNLVKENPEIELHFNKITESLMKEFRREIK